MSIFGPVLDARPLLPQERAALLELLGSLDPAHPEDMLMLG